MFRDVTVKVTFRKMKDVIPTKLLLGTISDSLTNLFNRAKNDGKYPNSLKTTNITSLPKGGRKMMKMNLV